MTHANQTANSVDPCRAREFALQVVQELRGNGHQALWAGGCVRDKLRGIQPQDYDVATDALPEQVRQIFGRRRTLAIGAAFGVVMVLGPKRAGQVEVATFRRDANYSDGRHPDHVTFSSPQEDAQRRDFTINGLFYDPIDDKTIDYVGGQADLQRRLIRAIGNPQDRFAEDKLRMLRAVRFAATFDFEIDSDTFQAIQQHAHEIEVVSAERIAAELRRMLTTRQRAGAMELLRSTRLLAIILPEIVAPDGTVKEEGRTWHATLEILDHLDAPTFPMALAVLLAALEPHPPVRNICQRWRLANDEVDAAAWFVAYEALIRQADLVSWPKIQRLLIEPLGPQLVDVAAAIAQVTDTESAGVEYCRKKLSLPEASLNPPPLLNGDDLIVHGLEPGKLFRHLLTRVRDAQLEGHVQSREEAMEMVADIVEADESQ
jgi:poly(A) polymerase